MKLNRSFSVILLALLLSACIAATPDTPHNVSTTAIGFGVGAAGGAAVGAIVSGPGAFVGATIGGMAGLIVGRDLQDNIRPYNFIMHQLTQMGIQVLPIGEQVTLLIPSDEIFYATSPRLTRNAKPILNTITVFLSHYRMISMEVDAYTDNVGPSIRNLKLSQARADAVAQYLWAQPPLDSRMIFTYGYGEKNPIANNSSPEGRANNRRIAIRFEWIPTYG